jgi:hypothetical protein
MTIPRSIFNCDKLCGEFTMTDNFLDVKNSLGTAVIVEYYKFNIVVVDLIDTVYKTADAGPD